MNGNYLFMLSVPALAVYYSEAAQRHAAILIKTNCFPYRRAKQS